MIIIQLSKFGIGFLWEQCAVLPENRGDSRIMYTCEDA